MTKYDVSYFNGGRHRVVRVYANLPVDDIKKWMVRYFGASNLTVKEADTTDDGLMIVRL